MFRFAVALLLALAAATPVRAAPNPTLLARVQAAAEEAQTRCYRLIHHDTLAYHDCLLGLLADERKAGPRRLGIEYFGFVGAQNSARLGMRGADFTAWTFLRRYRQTQKRLHIDDASLCSTIPGDCEVRIARARLIERAPPPPAPDSEADQHHDH